MYLNSGHCFLKTFKQLWCLYESSAYLFVYPEVQILDTAKISKIMTCRPPNSVNNYMFSKKTHWHGTLQKSLVFNLTFSHSYCTWVCKDSWSKLSHKQHMKESKVWVMGKQKHHDYFWGLLSMTWDQGTPVPTLNVDQCWF